jgi:hypothetical protein
LHEFFYAGYKEFENLLVRNYRSLQHNCIREIGIFTHDGEDVKWGSLCEKQPGIQKLSHYVTL